MRRTEKVSRHCEHEVTAEAWRIPGYTTLRQHIFPSVSEAAGFEGVADSSRSTRSPAPAEVVTCVLNVGIALGDPHEPHPGPAAGPAAKVSACLGDFIGLGFNAFNTVPVGTPVKVQAEGTCHGVIPNLKAMA